MDNEPNNPTPTTEPVTDAQFKTGTSLDQPNSAPPVAGDTISPAPEPSSPVSEATNSEPALPAATDHPLANDNQMAIAPKQHKGGKPVMVIVLVVVVALSLAGLTVFMYLKSKPKPAASTQSNTASVVEKPQASPSDVDTTNQEIDTNLSKTDDSKDFAPGDISDKTLGL